MSTGRYVDAHENSQYDYSLVTRPYQENNTQKWVLHSVGAVYTIQHVSNGRYIDAHENSKHDYSLVTRPEQQNDTQQWIIRTVQ